MTPEDEKMLNLQFERLERLIIEQSDKQGLKDQNIILQLQGLAGRIEANMDMTMMIADNDRKDLIETRDNTRETNGRVLKLEQAENNHIINCPQVKKIDEINKSIEDLTFVQRHPTLFIGIVIAAVIVTLYFK